MVGHVPRIWNATIDQHRRAVHDAILDTTASLIAEHGLTGVTMSQIAQHAGIGRATLYKYFPDVEAILAAWHQRQIAQHLDQLREAADAANDPVERLRTVLRSYTELSSSRPTGGAGAHRDADMTALLHRSAHSGHSRDQVHALMTDVIRAAGDAGHVRTDIPPDELATFCLHALGAARSLDRDESHERLVRVTLQALTTRTEA